MAASGTNTLEIEEPRLDAQSLLPGPAENYMLVAKIFVCTNGHNGATVPRPKHRSADSNTVAWRRLISGRGRARRMRQIYSSSLGEPPEEGVMKWDTANCDASVLLQVAAECARNGQGITFLKLLVHSPTARQFVGARGVVVTFKPCNQESITSLIYLLHYFEATTVGTCCWKVRGSYAHTLALAYK
ncbi:hypothetical protein INS49_007234 [Diaporthe citri]|uniref:uncharacterized protein n=1 Tax=Diaporthe citri TaxID=83186 RepID=UPI001C8267B2|nr:uncharacterized protein INS49_007234 [Diaporthe citri]KAG6365623.1 hypothetical protein INS49_007234 [Diaporthe citri]